MSNHHADQYYQQAIEEWLRQRIGLNPQSLGQTTLAQAIASLQRQLGFDTLAAYWHHLQGSDRARNQLIEALVVPETSFFRTPESFHYLRQYVVEHRERFSAQRPLRISSVPCSTGEEPYSIAITLLQAGMRPDCFVIDAVDISEMALSKAQCGRYWAYSFRPMNTGKLPFDLHRYFTGAEGVYVLDPFVRSQVTFHQDNLATATCLSQHPPYDIVFCRNLLIYFHATARDRALANLHRLLVANGLLFVGYAEVHLLNPEQFAPIDYPHAFAYRKLPPSASPPPHRSTSSQLVPAPPSVRSSAVVPPRFPSPPITPAPAISPATISLRDLTEIRAIADRGEFVTATQECQRYLLGNPVSSDAYLLLGEIYQARGMDNAALDAFRRSIYLRPTCQEALLHLILLYQQRGEGAIVQQLQQRLSRLQRLQNE